MFSSFAESIFKRTYAFSPDETWEGCARRVAKAVAFDAKQEQSFFEMIRDRVFVPGGRYIYSSGRPKFMNSNCYGFVAGDSREEWARLLHDATMCLSTGGGLGVNYDSVRSSGSPIRTLGGVASGPLSLMQMVNEVARHVMAGGKRRSALWAGLAWNHGDIERFIRIKDWDENIREMKAKQFEYPAPLDMTNISVTIDRDYLWKLFHNDPEVTKLHTLICESMIRTGEPAFRNQARIQHDDPTAVTGNACQESTLCHNDTCNLGSIVLPRVRDLNHLEEVTRLAIQFLLNGSMKASYPTPDIAAVAKRNRRIGLGVMGLHEFMLMNNHRYEWFDKLNQYAKTWAEVCREEASAYAWKHNENTPVTTRAIAPTGTISIVGETTSGVEPIYCVAYKRRYIDGFKRRFQYVIDPTARRLVEMGVKPADIEDTYSLSRDLSRRLEVQARLQEYVDQAISNTINLTPYGTEGNRDVESFMAAIKPFLPRLKGLACYPDGARSGQPLSPVGYDEAKEQVGVIFEEDGERCLNGVCGL